MDELPELGLRLFDRDTGLHRHDKDIGILGAGIFSGVFLLTRMGA